MNKILWLSLLTIYLSGCGAILHSPGDRRDLAVESASKSNGAAIADSENPPGDRPEPKPGNLAFLSGKASSVGVNERVVLLSIKHKIPESNVEGILVDYLSEHNNFKNNPDYKQTLTEISRKYDVPLEKVAQVILDYKAWLATGKG